MMWGKRLLVILMLLTVMSMAYADPGLPDINTLNADGNYYSVTGTSVTISWALSDANAPGQDVNVWIYYVDRTTMTRTEITSDTVAARDHNVTNYCSSGVTSTPQVCTYAWTLPANLDDNYFFDINVMDVVSPDDNNELRNSSFYIDTNACQTSYTLSGNDVSFDVNCTGTGSTATIYQGKTRTRVCPDNYDSIVAGDTESSSFGEITMCFYSVDSLGQQEATQTFIFTADSDAYNIALLAELALAGLLLFLILGGVVLRGEALTERIMIPIVVGAVLIAIMIYIFAVIL